MELKGRIALVTGASKGIGEAISLALASEGVRVALAARNQERLRALEEAIRKEGGEAIAITADFSSEPQIEGAFQKIEGAFGRLDILVNNAGIGVFGKVGELQVNDYRRMLETNLLGPIVASHYAVNLMKRAGSGHIVNVSSVAGHIGTPGWASYNASKWGLRGFSESLRKELIPFGIKVSVLSPGVVESEWGENMPEDWLKRRNQEVTPLTPEDMASAVMFLLQQPERVCINEILVRPTNQER